MSRRSSDPTSSPPRVRRSDVRSVGLWVRRVVVEALGDSLVRRRRLFVDVLESMITSVSVAWDLHDAFVFVVFEERVVEPVEHLVNDACLGFVVESGKGWIVC